MNGKSRNPRIDLLVDQTRPTVCKMSLRISNQTYLNQTAHEIYNFSVVVCFDSLINMEPVGQGE